MSEEMEVNVDNGSTQRKSRYRQLLNDVEDIAESENVGLNAVNQVTSILHEASVLHDQCDPDERVKHLDETLLDHKVLSSAADVLVKCTRAIDLDTTIYEPADFCAVLLEKLMTDDNKLNFLDLLEDAKKIIPTTPFLVSLYSACDFTKVPEPKEKRVKQKAAKEVVQKKELISVVNQKQADESEDTIAFIHKVLKKECERQQTDTLNYYDFVIDTSDFGATVENIFYCSFLVREGKVGLAKEDQVLKIILKSTKQLEAYRKTHGVNSEWISSIDMDLWKQFTKEGYLQKYRKKYKGVMNVDRRSNECHLQNINFCIKSTIVKKA